MRKVFVTIACALGVALSATNANAVTLSVSDLDPYYLGSADPGSPASAEWEVYYINYLASMALNDIDVDVDPPSPPAPPNQEHTFDRSDNPFPFLATATITGAMRDDTSPSTHIEFSPGTGFFYLLAKYGNTSYVWVISGLTVIDIPASLGMGGGLSHWSLYTPVTTVPDGGATLGLLGLAMLGLGFMRQRMA